MGTIKYKIEKSSVTGKEQVLNVHIWDQEDSDFYNNRTNTESYRIDRSKVKPSTKTIYKIK